MNLIKTKKVKGFTLIELMIVVAIIGILAAVAIPKFAELVSKSKESAVKGNVGSVRSALSIYYGDTEGVNPLPASFYAALTNGDKYMNTSTGLGDFTLPTTLNNIGHTGGRIAGAPAAGQAKVLASDGQVASDAAGTASPLVYNGQLLGQVFVNCTHMDTKGTSWSGN